MPNRMTGGRPKRPFEVATLAVTCFVLVACGNTDHARSNNGESERSFASDSSCAAQPSAPTAGWHTVRTKDGRLEFKLPPGTMPLQGSNGDVWGLPMSGTVGYIADTRNQRRPSTVGWCVQRIAGVTARILIGYGEGNSGEGTYTQVVLPLGRAGSAHLIGFVPDSGSQKVITAIVASTTIVE